MKLQNLILTGLVALALGACSSSDNETASNNGNAVFSFKISMPAGTTSRADSYSNDGTEVGSVSENALQSVAIKVVYGGSVADVSKTFTKDDFDATPTDNSVVYTLKAIHNIEVAPGTVTVYAVVNGDMVAENATQSATYSTTSLDGVEDGIAKANNFLMSGKTTGVTITEATTNSATIKVDRVAARVDEGSPTTGFTTDIITPAGTEHLTSTIQSYTLLNLNKTTNVFAQTAPYAPTDAAANFVQYFKATKSNSFDYTNTATITKVPMTKTYILENGAARPTQVAYAVKISDGGVGIVDGANLYVKGGKLYKSFSALDAAFDHVYSNTWLLKDGSSYADFLKAGVEKYEGGICYYVRDLQTTTGTTSTSTIVRNNCYKLAVTAITGLGSPVIDPPVVPKPTLLNLTIDVQPWVVNLNSFDLQ